MTKEEATKKIKKVIEESTIFDDEVEAFDMAIKALEVLVKLENGAIKKHSGSFIAYNREWLFNGNNLEMEFDLLRKTRDAIVKKGIDSCEICAFASSQNDCYEHNKCNEGIIEWLESEEKNEIP